MPATPIAEDPPSGTLAHETRDRLAGERVMIRARLVMVVSALAIGLLTMLSFDPGPASVLEVALGTGASVAFLVAIGAALAILGSGSRSMAPVAGTAAAARSSRVLVAGFLVGMTLVIALGFVAGLAALGEAPTNSPDAGAPFESTSNSTHATRVDRV